MFDTFLSQQLHFHLLHVALGPFAELFQTTNAAIKIQRTDEISLENKDLQESYLIQGLKF